jgi:hypothetical protein
MNREQILQHFKKDTGLLEKIFWKSSDILYDFEFEKAKQRLKSVYNKQDVDEVFPSQLDEEKLRSILDILFRVPQIWPWLWEEEEQKKFLWIF